MASRRFGGSGFTCLGSGRASQICRKNVLGEAQKGWAGSFGGRRGVGWRKANLGKRGFGVGDYNAP